jgi:hypothetical protein
MLLKLLVDTDYVLMLKACVVQAVQVVEVID